MKKILCICLIACGLLFSACKDEEITSSYSIGCLNYSGYLESDWMGFERYMNALTNYNAVVFFTNPTQELNDAAAAAYFDEEYAKLNPDSLMSFIAPYDCLTYGIGSSLDSVSFRVIKGVNIYADRVEPYTPDPVYVAR